MYLRQRLWKMLWENHGQAHKPAWIMGFWHCSNVPFLFSKYKLHMLGVVQMRVMKTCAHVTLLHCCLPAQSTTHSTMSSQGSAAAGMWSTCTACCGPRWCWTWSAFSWESLPLLSSELTRIWWAQFPEEVATSIHQPITQERGGNGNKSLNKFNKGSILEEEKKKKTKDLKTIENPEGCERLYEVFYYNLILGTSSKNRGPKIPDICFLPSNLHHVCQRGTLQLIFLCYSGTFCHFSLKFIKLNDWL